MPAPPTTPNGEPIREKILLYGDSDAGKTFAALRLAHWHQRRGSDARFYAMCSAGNEWGKFFAAGAEFEGLGNVEHFPVADIGDYFEVYDRKIRHARAQDWLIVDVLGDGWQAAQDEFSRRMWGEDLGSRWATEGGRHPISEEENWPWGSINSRYRAWAQNRMLRFKGHLLGLAWDKKWDDKLDGAKDRHGANLFGLIGQKPVGQKDDYKRFDTVIHLGFNQLGERIARTAKDRGGRRRLGTIIDRGTGQNRVVSHVGEPCPDFFLTYLKGIAGWSM